MEDSLRVIDAALKVTTPYGPSWRRYNHDGYGPKDDGKPYTGWGIGRAWPLLTGERAHYELAAGRDVRAFITAMEKFASSSGMLPEQIWDAPDLPQANMFLGKPCGAAMPLMWAHAEYIKLLRSVAEGQVFDRIPLVADRYLNKKGRSDLEIWKASRRVREIAAGKVLRVQALGDFRLQWAIDGANPQESASVPSGLGLSYIDIATSAGQTAVQFTFVEAKAEDLENSTHQVRIL